MEYKILITLSIDLSSPLKTFIEQTDVIRGEPCSLSLTFKNIGTEIFPGGKIQSLRVDYSPIGTSFTSWSEEWNCSPLSPEKRGTGYKCSTCSNRGRSRLDSIQYIIPRWAAYPMLSIEQRPTPK